MIFPRQGNREAIYSEPLLRALGTLRLMTQASRQIWSGLCNLRSLSAYKYNILHKIPGSIEMDLGPLTHVISYNSHRECAQQQFYDPHFTDDKT